MDGLVFKTKKKPVTYGKAARKQGHGRPVDLDSDDELAVMDRHISGKISKSSTQRYTQAATKFPPAQRFTTPPVSTSPSITSPSSSTGTKRTSPFLDASPEEQKKRVRLTSTGSASSLEDMFPVAEAKKRKPVPKLNKRKAVEPTASTSDDTQILLDNQLQETPYPKRDEPSVTTKKSSGLKMPTRVRNNAKPAELSEQKSSAIQTSSTAPIVTRKTNFKAQNVANEQKSKQDRKPAQSMTARPRTPEKPRLEHSPLSIISPSNLELDVLRISSVQTNRQKTPERKLLPPISHASPKPSPFRPKLKDRMTTDLTDMVDELDTSTTEISMASPMSQRTRTPIAVPAKPDINESEDSQRISTQASTQPSQIQGPKVTYGATRWTFLPDEDEGMDLLNPILDSQDSNGHGKKSRQLPDLAKSTSHLTAFDLDEDDDDEPTATMRSLHELKRAGGSQRLNRQIEALLDDVEHSTTKAQRITALLELVSKLKQSTFLRQFVDAGSEARLLALMDQTSETITKILYSTALLLVLNAPNLSTISLETEPLKVSLFLSGLLKHKPDVSSLVRLRNNHVSKDSQIAIDKLYNSMRTSSVWSFSKPSTINGQLLGLACLERLIRRLRESGYRGELLSEGTVDLLVNGLSEWTDELDNDRLFTWLSLSILESASLVYSLSLDLSEQTSWTEQTGMKLVSFITRLLNPASTRKHGDLVSLALRISLNLSNCPTDTCSIFRSSRFVRATLATTTTLFQQISSTDDSIDQDLVLDNLVLSLGLIINLSEKMVEMRSLFLEEDAVNHRPLDTLLQLFTSRLQEAFEITSEAKIRSNVPFGYLAILIGYLCKTPAIFFQVRSQLEGGNLRLLLIAIREFLQYHQKVEELKTSSGESDTKISFISRLQGLLDELRDKEHSI